MIVDVKKAHLGARCGEGEEEGIELLEEFSRCGRSTKRRNMLK